MGIVPETRAPPLVDARGLWAVRVAAAFSLLLLGVTPFLRWDPCLLGPSNILAGRVPWVTLMPPYVLVLWWLRRGTARAPGHIRRGLALAVPWGGAVALLVVLFGLLPSSAISLDNWESFVIWGTFSLLAAGQLTLVVSAIKAYYSVEPEPRHRNLLLKNFALVVVLALIFLALVIPRVFISILWAPEAATVGALRMIYTAQVSYARTHPAKGFARTLKELGPPPGPDLLPLHLTQADIKVWCYRFTFVPGAPGTDGRVVRFTLTARPLVYKKSGVRSFYTDQTGLIHFTTEDRPATAQDPPLP